MVPIAPPTRQPDLQHLLRDRLRRQSFPEFGGLALWLARPESRLGALTAKFGGGTPYWGFAWPGGLALCAHLFAHPETVRGRRVLDFGAGSGLVGCAAHLCGATAVGFADADRLAQAAFRLNAAENGFSPLDLAEQTLGPGDVVLAGDVFYDVAAAAASLDGLTALLRQGATILVGDPFRPHLPRQRLVEIDRRQVREVGASPSQPAIAAGIFVLAPDPDRG